MAHCAFVTLGCKVNQYDTQALREALARLGWHEVSPNAEADAYIVNTCCVTRGSHAKGLQAIRRIARAHPNAAIVVTGCSAETEADALRQLPGVRLVLPNASKPALPELLTNALRADGGSPSLSSVTQHASRVPDLWPPISRFAGHTRAFVKIEDGCDDFCSYCIVPHVRGRVRNRPPDEVAAEVARLVANGYLEVVLTGIHLGAYGLDSQSSSPLVPPANPPSSQGGGGGMVEPPTCSDPLPALSPNNSPRFSFDAATSVPLAEPHEGPQAGRRPRAGDDARIVGSCLAGRGVGTGSEAVEDDGRGRGREAGCGLVALVERLVATPGLRRLRLSSLELREVSDELIALAASSPIICPHFHIPLQSGDDAVLHAMNRRYTAAEFLRRLDAIRARIEEPAITTDIIVGFPGETDEQFRRTLDVARQAAFSRIHVFPYSDRPGTPAARMPGKLPWPVIKARREEMKALAADLMAAYHRRFVGSIVEPLVESRRDPRTGLLCGYTERYVRVLLDGPDAFRGAIVPVRAVAAAPGGLRAERP